MLYFNEGHIKAIGIDWNATTAVIADAVRCLDVKDYSQPIKPYLRYRDPKNRIIAMPAFVGGNINMAGIKWIASFPGNIHKGIPRAHSVVVLNDADTGEPVCVIATALLSIIRTASVSGLVIKYFDDARKPKKIKLGIAGFGPIGRYHLKMCEALLGHKIDKISLYDIRPIDPSLIERNSIAQIADSWEEAYLDADIFITCTVSDAPYIDKPPKPGSLHLNVSLRDYANAVYEHFKDAMLVDDWEEVCREKTDIERMHLEKNLKKEDTRSILDLVKDHCLEKYDPLSPVLFNPMGLGIFDIAIGSYYYRTGRGDIIE